MKKGKEGSLGWSDHSLLLSTSSTE